MKACQTIYLSNLTEKLSKKQLRRQLYNICSKFGPLLDVIVHPGKITRGQAWVVFETIEAARIAVKKLNSYEFFEKPIKADFAKENSDVILKLEGKFVMKERKKRIQEEKSSSSKKSRTDDGGGHDANNPPAPLLKADNLPEELTKETLVELFSKFDGFKEVRHVPGKSIAFIEFLTTDQAKLARDNLKGYQLTSTNKLRLYYAKIN